MPLPPNLFSVADDADWLDAPPLRPADAPFALHLLGVPEFRHCGSPVAIARTQTRALLFRLGTSAEPTPRSELAALFWPETDDATARQNLRRLLSLARSELPDPDALAATSEAVSLNPRLVWSDARVIEELQHVDALDAWQTIADLYRGSFLSGFFLRNNASFELWQTSMAERLRTRGLNALARLIDHSTARGDYEQAVQYARRYLEIDSVAETIHRHLITLYARLGERDLALRQFGECTLILERELGVEPLPETRAACNLARQNRTLPFFLSAPPAACQVLPSLELPLVGREAALRQLTAAFGRHKHGGLLLLTGESGIGKSRLLQVFLAQQSARVLTGNCHAGSELLAYHPVVDAFRQAAGAELGRGVDEVWLAEAEQLLPELRTLFPRLPARKAAHVERVQARLFEALVQLLLGLAARQQVILCLEDIHWADSASIAWLHYALTRLRGRGVCVIATSALPLTENVGALLRDLDRGGQTHEIRLGSLAPADVLSILHAVKAPQPQDAATAARIHAAAGGNTFFVLELIRELRRQGLLDCAPDPLPVPQTIHNVIERRLSDLNAKARQVLEAAAVLNPELDFEVLRATTGRDDQEVSDGVDQLAEHQLLLLNEKGASFHHSIVQATVYAGLNPWRRRLLHKRAAEALVRLGRQRGRYLHAAVAAHFAAAGNEQIALYYYCKAAQAALSHASARMAVEYAQHGLRLAGAATVRQLVADLWEVLGDGLAMLGQLNDALEAYAGALARLAPAETLQTAGLIAKRANTLVLQGLHADAAAAVRTALAQLELLADGKAADALAPDWWSVWLDLHLEQARMYVLQPRRAKLPELLQILAPLVARHGELRQQHALARIVKRSELWRSGFDADEDAVEGRRQALSAALSSGFPRETAEARVEYGFGLLLARRLPEAREVLSAAIEETQALGMVVLQLKATAHLLIVYRFQEDVAHSSALHRPALELAQVVGSPIYLGMVKAEQAWALLRQGDRAEAAGAVEAALRAWQHQEFPMRWLALWVLLALQTELGALGEAAQTARLILDAYQSPPPTEAAVALTRALDAWAAEDAVGARRELQSALQTAYCHHYL